ncbi:MAG: hypothetical protein WCI31_13185 [Prolixibacteraceae bacterium]
MEIQTLYQEAIKFATTKHLEQKQPVPEEINKNMDVITVGRSCCMGK